MQAELDAALLLCLCSDGSSMCVEALQASQSCQVLAVSCWKFCRESGCAVKLFCSSARGIAVNLLRHKSDSSFLGTGNLLFSCVHLFSLKCFSVNLLECWGLILWLMVGKRGSYGWPQDTLFYVSLCTLQPDTLGLDSSSVYQEGSYFLWSVQAMSWGKWCLLGKIFFLSDPWIFGPRCRKLCVLHWDRRPEK